VLAAEEVAAALRLGAGDSLDLPDLAPTVAALAARGVKHLKLCTSGRSLSRSPEARRAISAGGVGISVCLLGTDPASHDRITGVAGSFRETLDGLRLLRPAGRDTSCRAEAYREAHVVVGPENDRQLAAMVVLAAGIGFHRIVLDARGYSGDPDTLVRMVEKACRTGCDHDIWVVLLGLPPCRVPQLAAHHGGLFGLDPTRGTTTTECEACSLQAHCPGPSSPDEPVDPAIWSQHTELRNSLIPFLSEGARHGR